MICILCISYEQFFNCTLFTVGGLFDQIQIFYVLVEEEEEARPDSSDDDEEEEASLSSRGTRGGRRRGQASAGSLGVTRGRKWPRTTHPASRLVEVMGKWENKDTLPIIQLIMVYPAGPAHNVVSPMSTILDAFYFFHFFTAQVWDLLVMLIPMVQESFQINGQIPVRKK